MKGGLKETAKEKKKKVDGKRERGGEGGRERERGE